MSLSGRPVSWAVGDTGKKPVSTCQSITSLINRKGSDLELLAMVIRLRLQLWDSRGRARGRSAVGEGARHSHGLSRGTGPCQDRQALTQEDAAGHTRDALDLREVVLGEVVVAGGAGRGAVAEEAPECGGPRAVVRGEDLGTDVKAASR